MTKSEEVKCTHCERTFKNNADMRRHRTQAHVINKKLIAFPIEVGTKLVQDEEGNLILGGVFIPDNYELVSVSQDKHYMRHRGENFNVHVAFLVSKDDAGDRKK